MGATLHGMAPQRNPSEKKRISERQYVEWTRRIAKQCLRCDPVCPHAGAMDFSDPVTLMIAACVFVLAGLVKGVIGMGLPTVVLGLLAATADLAVAMALMLAPSLATNLWQAFSGGHLREILRVQWPFLFAAILGIAAGAQMLTRVDLGLLSALLGVLLAVYGAVGLAGLHLTVPARSQPWAGTGIGAVNGILTGMTGSFIVPGVMYLQACGLARDALVQAMGVLFLVSTAALAVALRQNSFLTDGLALASVAAIVPALVGMAIGQRIRHGLSEPVFRRVFLISTVLLGLYLAGRLAV